MEQLRQTQANINDLFVRLAAEKAALDGAMQRCADRDAKDHELLSAVGDFAKRQRRAEDVLRDLLKKQSESERIVEEGMMRVFKEKKETDERIRKEIEGVFKKSVREAQEMETLLRGFGVTLPPADGSGNSGLVQPASDDLPHLAPVSSAPSLSVGGRNSFTNSVISSTLQKSDSVISLTSLDIPNRPSPSILASQPSNISAETNHEPRVWDFFEYEDHMPYGGGSDALTKPPFSFTFCEPNVTIPTVRNLLPWASVENNVDIPIPDWPFESGKSVREIEINGARVLRNGNVELAIRMSGSGIEPGALEELTQKLTNYHHGTTHKLASNELNSLVFAAVKSSHGNAWHRGRILQARDRHADVLFIDSGFHETVSFENIRPLPMLFRFLPQQSRKARLSLVKLPEPKSQHHKEAHQALQKACAGRKLKARLDNETRGDGRDRSTYLLHLRLMDLRVDPDDILASVNAELLRDSLAIIDSTEWRGLAWDRATSHLLAMAVMSARDEGVGMYRREVSVSR